MTLTELRDALPHYQTLVVSDTHLCEAISESDAYEAGEPLLDLVEVLGADDRVLTAINILCESFIGMKDDSNAFDAGDLKRTIAYWLDPQYIQSVDGERYTYSSWHSLRLRAGDDNEKEILVAKFIGSQVRKEYDECGVGVDIVKTQTMYTRHIDLEWMDKEHAHWRERLAAAASLDLDNEQTALFVINRIQRLVQESEVDLHCVDFE